MHIARLQRAAKGGSGVILSTVQVAAARAAVRQQRRRAVGHDCIARVQLAALINLRSDCRPL